MKVIFYGSIDSSRTDYSQIETNLKALVRLMARHGAEFIVRCVNSTISPTTVPADTIVLQALKECSDKGQKVDATVLYEPSDPKAASWGLPRMSHP